jgi:hypothetical protein
VPISGFSKAKKLLDKAAIAELREALGDPKARTGNYRIHDFRVTCESRPADLGFNQDVHDAVLGHAKIGLQRTLNKQSQSFVTCAATPLMRRSQGLPQATAVERGPAPVRATDRQ